MATPKSQRIGILIIAIVLIIGTIGSFFVMILAGENAKKDQAKLEELKAQFSKQVDAYQAKVDTQTKQLSDEYYPVFSQYKDVPRAYEIDSVGSDLKTEDLLVGGGQEIDDTTAFAAYYIGWNPDGKVFDSSLGSDALKAPIRIDNGLAKAGLIEGWKEGLKGMKIGGVRLVEIPSDKAYGEAGQGDDIPPNTPLKFVVMAVDLPEEIQYPEIPNELYQGLQ